MTRVLFVCLGNICRSPTAEGVFRAMVARAGLGAEVVIESAGTSASHAGEGADRRTVRHASQRGYDLSGHVARQVRDEDFAGFDLILAMDAQNLAELRDRCPPEHARKLRLFLDYGMRGGPREVPDPYTGGSHAFERVIDLVEEAAFGLLEQVKRRRTAT